MFTKILSLVMSVGIVGVFRAPAGVLNMIAQALNPIQTPVEPFSSPDEPDTPRQHGKLSDPELATEEHIPCGIYINAKNGLAICGENNKKCYIHPELVYSKGRKYDPASETACHKVDIGEPLLLNFASILPEETTDTHRALFVDISHRSPDTLRICITLNQQSCELRLSVKSDKAQDLCIIFGECSKWGCLTVTVTKEPGNAQYLVGSKSAIRASA